MGDGLGWESTPFHRRPRPEVELEDSQSKPFRKAPLFKRSLSDREGHVLRDDAEPEAEEPGEEEGWGRSSVDFEGSGEVRSTSSGRGMSFLSFSCCVYIGC